MNSMSRAFVAVLLLGAVLAGCSHNTSAPPQAGSAGQAGSTGTSGMVIGSVVVTYASSLANEDRARLDEVNAKSELKRIVEKVFTNLSRFRSGSPRTLEIEVTSFRLRSGTTVFLTGLLSGADSLDVRVTVREKGAVVRQLNSGDATAGNFGGTTAVSRFENMAKGLGKRLGREL